MVVFLLTHSAAKKIPKVVSQDADVSVEEAK